MIPVCNNFTDVERYMMSALERIAQSTGAKTYCKSPRPLVEQVTRCLRRDTGWSFDNPKANTYLFLPHSLVNFDLIIKDIYTALGWIITLDLEFCSPIDLKGDEDEAELLFRFARMCSILKHDYGIQYGAQDVTLWVTEPIKILLPIGAHTRKLWLNLDPDQQMCFQEKSMYFQDSDAHGTIIEMRCWQLTNQISRSCVEGSTFSSVDPNFHALEISVPLARIDPSLRPENLYERSAHLKSLRSDRRYMATTQTIGCKHPESM
ncbi:hypothetical protein QCA50_011884 [Cerrena zonata]|uniref:Uncharacterized protein n=1 Tax=Cerrena zonata TaxID=2478898 RepID=A0AAW0G5V8_9APHY